MDRRRNRLSTVAFILLNVVSSSTSNIVPYDEESNDVDFILGTQSCYTTPDGRDYTGTVSVTESGLGCQKWSSQSPHSHREFKPYPELQNHNYCRNPGSSGSRAWCYTTDPDTRWEYCDVGSSKWSCLESPDIECYMRYDAKDYRGNVNVTTNGKTCQRWDVQEPHGHTYRGDDFTGEHNHCRNPNGANRPWCYTSDPNIPWDYCNVCGEGPVNAQSNIALNKEASQSSLYHGPGVASHAVDGFKSDIYIDESCTHTNLDFDAWWKVDLKFTYFVQEIVITNRQDCCAERLAGAVVRVGFKNNIKSNKQCGTTVTESDANQRTLTFTCEPGTVGRFVSVQLEGIEEYLTLCEVEVRGHRAELWRHDGRCGLYYKTVSNMDAQCNPEGKYPCCSAYGWCGISRYHCDCEDCIDYREVEVYSQEPTTQPAESSNESWESWE